ncbi:MAG: tRNA (guanosine(37)-N1)-methyltransferase TrmD [Andreesenia angusta]|nr:tRNA (guanosine(37)-N1)-methyltransferase TrmD [Andreesenia angusta]
MKIDIMTLFPEMFKETLGTSIIGNAIEKGIVDIEYTDIREFSNNKHNKVDDYPFGGGKGMLIKAEPVYEAVMSKKKESSKVIYLSPKGKVFNQDMAIELSKEEHLILVCGHYEGIDQRAIDLCIDQEISIGDYVLTGGELGAMVLSDAIIRLLPGVLSDDESFEIESHYNGLLEFPQYTRPRIFKDLKVPDILLSGNHKKIEEWRFKESIKATYKNRPDLLMNRKFTEEEKKVLDEIKNIRDEKK